jgi:hypothetical protein
MVNSVEFDGEAVKKHLDNLEWVEEKALAHEGIIEEIMENYAVLPMRFLTLYETEQNLLEFIKNHYKIIVDNLAVAEKNVEYSVKVYYNKEILKNSVSEAIEIKKERDIIALKSKGLSYMLMKKLEEKIAVQIENNLNVDAQAIYKRIESLSENIIIKEAQKNNEGLIDMIFSIVVLVNKLTYEELVSEVSKINDEYSEKGYLIEQSGPWPIYNFIKI